MIYIDPPYNTGHDFVYNDDFSAPLDNYLKQTGQKNGDGDSTTTNKETNGRYHSDWLSMMYPRLKLAWSLLKDDGVIFISIDDNEVHHLRMIMDEIFGEENFISTLHWRKVEGKPGQAGQIGKVVEYILIYGKYKNNVKLGKLPLPEKAKKEYRYSDEKGVFRRGQIYYPGRGSYSYNVKTPYGTNLSGDFTVSNEEFNQLNEKGLVYWAEKGDHTPYLKVYLEDTIERSPTNDWTEESGSNQGGIKEFKEIFEGLEIFDNPKPTKLIQKIISFTCQSNDVILDFFAGSGTTAHAVFKQNHEDGGNRKFILVQLPEKLEADSEAYKAGYKTISEISKKRIQRVIRGYGADPQTLSAGFKFFKLDGSNYPANNFVFDPEKSSEENHKEFVAYLQKAKQKKLFSKDDDMSLVYENIVKEGLSLNSKIEKTVIGKNSVYQVIDGDQQLLVCLEDKLAPETVKELTDKTLKDRIFICLESSLDDTTAANLALNLDLKTI